MRSDWFPKLKNLGHGLSGAKSHSSGVLLAHPFPICQTRQNVAKMGQEKKKKRTIAIIQEKENRGYMITKPNQSPVLHAYLNQTQINPSGQGTSIDWLV